MYSCVQKDMYYIETLKYNTGKDSLAHLLGPCIYFFPKIETILPSVVLLKHLLKEFGQTFF